MARFPGKALTTLVLVALMFPWAAALPGILPAPAPARQEIRLSQLSFDPLIDALPPGARLASLDAAGPFLVQFEGRAGAASARAVVAAGGEIDAVVAQGAFVVTGPAGLGRALARLDGVRWVGVVPPSARLHPGVAGASTLSVSYGGGAPAILGELRAAAASVMVIGLRSALVSPGPGGAAALAALPHVLFVAPYTPPSADNYRAVLTDGLRQASNASAYTTAGGALWVFNGNSADPRFLGYTGEGVTVDVTDEGVDGTHPAFAGRLGSATTWSGTPAWQDFTGHGTHVAASALGSGAYFAADGSLAPGLYAGAAPGATLVSQNYNAAALNASMMGAWAAGAGATISVNSWGDSGAATQGAYTAQAAEYDAMTYDASPLVPGDQPLLFVFSAGNDYNAPGSVNAPATAKNVIAVGATGNDFPGLSPSAQITPFSSFGPADDLRIKPDLVAPGEMIASARSSGGPSGTGALPPYAGTSYVYKNGTSMAAPQVAGAAAVATQYLRDARGVAATPALLKALLINGADVLPGIAWPGAAQGWGRLNASASLLSTPARRVDFVQEGFVTFTDDGIADIAQFIVPLDAGSEFRASLVWTDHENNPLASTALWNDLDLEVRDPTGALVYEGNRINATTGFSDAGAAAHFDGVNNVEVVRISAAAAGNWSIFVRSHSFVSDPQTFALAYAGAINQTQPDLGVEALTLDGAPAEIASGDTVTLRGDLVNHGGSDAGSVVVEALNADDALAPPLDAKPLGNVSAGARIPFTLSFAPADGNNSVKVRARFAGSDGDPSNDAAALEFFVTRVQPQISGGAEAAALPGDPAVFSLTVTNRGNVADTFTLSEAPGIRDPAWAISLGPTSFALAADASAPISVSVAVPANASLGAFTPLELWLTSQHNASRADSIALTARAGAIRTLSLTSPSSSVSVAPGGAVQLQVHVTNLGNTAEDVDLTAIPGWPSNASWSVSPANATLPRGASADLFLTISNSDTGTAGFRGDLRVRAVLRSSGAAFELALPTFVEARPCLAFDPIAEVATRVGVKAIVPVVLTNCGNVRIAGPLAWGPLPGFAVDGPAWFDLSPGNSAFLDTGVTADAFAVEGAHTFAATADAGGGLTATASFTLLHRTQVNLVEVGERTGLVLSGGAGALRLVFNNRGGDGPVSAPRVDGVPPGWQAVALPSSAFVLAGANVTFELAVDAGADDTPKSVNLTLVFYPDSDREGALSPVVRVTIPTAITHVRIDTGAWPRSAAAGVALAVGAALAVVAAALVAPERGLRRTCPECGHRAPGFDTLLNPRCGQCGGRLQRKPPT